MNTPVAEFSPSVLPPCSLSLVMVRATRTTSPLWRWTLATGRWSTLQRTRRKTFTSTCAGRWCSREVCVHTCFHSVKPTVKMKHPTTTEFSEVIQGWPSAYLPWQAHGSVPPVLRPVWRLEVIMWVWDRWSPVPCGTEVSWSWSTAAARSVQMESATVAASSASSVKKTKWWGIHVVTNDKWCICILESFRDVSL